MQEIALLVSSLAGAFSAAAIKKFPKKTKLQSLGSSSQIRNQINSLRIEKEILTKTITRLYQSDSEVTKIQKDKLLLRYQHQLGIVLAKIEKLEEASHHPDLGPIGDGLITLMDQKLSQLDNRLYELSSKIQTANIQVPDIKEKKEQEKPEPKKDKPKENIKQTQNEQKQKVELDSAPLKIPYEFPKEPFEFTTLTSVSKNAKFPKFEDLKSKYDISSKIEKAKQKVEDKVEIVQSIGKSQQQQEFHKPSEPKQSETQKEPEKPKQPEETKIEVPKPITQKSLPAPDTKSADNEESDDDDLDRLKNEIMRSLSKLEQAEVE